MSTKATVARGPNFHLHREVLDDQYIYLELEGVPFEASYQRVMVPIPVHIWGIVRRYPGADLSFADRSDDELRVYVEEKVDERIARYEQAGVTRCVFMLRAGDAVDAASAERKLEEWAGRINAYRA